MAVNQTTPKYWLNLLSWQTYRDRMTLNSSLFLVSWLAPPLIFFKSWCSSWTIRGCLLFWFCPFSCAILAVSCEFLCWGLSNLSTAWRCLRDHRATLSCDSSHPPAPPLGICSPATPHPAQERHHQPPGPKPSSRTHPALRSRSACNLRPVNLTCGLFSNPRRPCCLNCHDHSYFL